MSRSRQQHLVIPRGLLPRPTPATDVYGIRRPSEGIIQILARNPQSGLSRVGHAHRGEPCPHGICITPRGTFDAGVRIRCEYIAPLRTVGTRNKTSTNLSHSHAVIVGAGSVGGGIALGLAQAGIGRLTLIDPDIVDTPNLSRTVYRYEDLGRHKVQALKERIASTRSGTRIKTITAPLAEMLDCSLIVASTDDATAQLQASRSAVTARTPALFAGCHVGAMSGEVLWVKPGETACYACTFGRIRGVGPKLRTTPYLAGARPRPELGLSIDVHHVTSVALAFAMALLADPARQALLANPARNLVLLQSGRSPNRRSRQMHLRDPFATSLPHNPRDPHCPQCGCENEAFLTEQRITVARLQREQ
jgi:ThiF family